MLEYQGIIPNYNRDSENNLVYEQTTENTSVNSNSNFIKMSGIPQEYNRVKLSIDGVFLTEVFDKDDITDATKFFCNYPNATIYVDPSLLGKKVTLTYLSCGNIMLSSDCICTKVSENGEVLEVLSDILDKGEDVVNAITSTGEFLDVLDQMATSIETGNAIVNNIDSIKTQLDNITANMNNFKSDVNSTLDDFEDTMNEFETTMQDKQGDFEQTVLSKYNSLAVTLLSQMQDIYNKVYPVGSIWMTTESSVDPNSLYGGTWIKVATGKNLVGVGTGTDQNGTTKTFVAGENAGEYSHKLNNSECGLHTTASEDEGYGLGIATGFKDRVFVSGTVNTYHNNVQPSYGVYIWKRTALADLTVSEIPDLITQYLLLSNNIVDHIAIDGRRDVYDYTSTTEGSIAYSDGTIQTSSSGYNVTDYIRVRAGVTYSIPSNRPQLLGVIYDNDKAFSYTLTGTTADSLTKPTTFTPIIDGYVRLNFVPTIVATEDYYVKSNVFKAIDWLKVKENNILDGSVTYAKQNFMDVRDGIIENEIYNDIAISGGLGSTGLSVSASGYLRTDYLPLPNLECTVTITDSSGVLPTPYVFLYVAEGLAGTRVTSFENSETGVYTFSFTDTSFKYMRMLTESPVWGDCSTTLSIKTTYNEESKCIINGYDLDTRYSASNKLARPSGGIVHFTNYLNVDFGYRDTTSTLSVLDGATTLTDNAILFLPTNYSSSGKPTRLVIACHGMSTNPITASTTTLAGAQSFLNSMGYAVLDVNGVPLSMSGNTNYHFGSPLALQSYLKAYKYAIDNYNLTKDVFVYGISMGGLTSNALVNSGSIPVVAQGNFCPVLDLYKQMYFPSVADRELFASLHGFEGIDSVTFTTSQNATVDEIELYMNNLDKLYGLSPIAAKCINWDNTYLDNINDTTEQTNYNSLIRLHPVPLKIWHNDDDTTVAPRYSNYYVNAIQKGGSIAQIRHFPSGGHNAWSNGDTTSVLDIDGNTVTPYASEYELYLWFKRFE